MNTTQRLTISLPNYLHEQLLAQIAPRQISRFITKVLEKALFVKTAESDSVSQFFALRKTLPKKTSDEIKEAIEWGRR